MKPVSERTPLPQTFRAERPGASAIASRRLTALVIGFALAFVAVLLRAWTLQVVERSQLAELGRRQVEQPLSIAAHRGRIVDRSGEHPLAATLSMPSIYVDPVMFRGDPRNSDPVLRATLADAVNLDPAELDRRLARDARFVWLGRQVLPQAANQVAGLRLTGVGVRPEGRRVYAGRETAAHVVGFVGIDGRGLDGIELIEDQALAGDATTLATEWDGKRRPLHPDGLGADGAEPAGDDVVLTLDLAIQSAAEDELAAAVRRHGARAGVAVVLDPRTGDILALASVPTFNPNEFGRFDAEQRRNRAVTDSFEPGSTLKAFLAAAALEAGIVGETDRIDCHDGAWKLAGHVVHDHTPHGIISFADVIRVSSNIGTAQVALALGARPLGAMLAGFGFGADTGLELPGEAHGSLRDPAGWRPIETATIAFGQGVSVTAIQLASAYGALANGGVRMAPRLVLGTRSARDGHLEERPIREAGRPISAETAHRVTRLLEVAASADGTGGAAQLPGITVAGKTGTAQKVVENGRGYDDERVVASFAGYVPAEDPRLVVVVVIDEPTGPITFGGQVAAPVFREIARRGLVALGASVDPGEAPSLPSVSASLDAHAGAAKPSKSALAVAAARELEPAADPSTFVPGRVPSLAGLSIRAVLRESARLGIAIEVDGRGVCVEQDPAPGVMLASGASMRARFEPASRWASRG